MFPAPKNDWAKNAKNKAKNKTNLLQYISLHITLLKIVLLQNDNKASKSMFLATQIDYAKKCKKSQKQNKLATARFTTYYSSKNYAFTKQH